jgi:two-component system, NtrC family, response regulator AtoC
VRGHLLLVDDDPSLRQTLAASLSAEGFVPVGAGGADEALALFQARPVEVVLTDIRMKGASGIDLCRRAREVRPEVPVVVMTAFGDLDAAVQAIRAGAQDFLAKPFEHEQLVHALDRAVQHARLRAEVARLQERLRETEPFEELLGESRGMAELCDLVRRVAATDSTVLIGGETGTGKELVARALHRRSRRAAGPFVPINCAAVPEALLESELFGHARGAFTDARGPRQGLFQRAAGGTLFLDEVGDMGLALQAKLLRALQERRVRPVGSDEEVPVDVRVVAATHQDLRAAVEAGTFRMDLLYRLAVVELEVPPLRARDNDVLLLAQHFVRAAAERCGKTVEGITPDAAARLLAYDWPGNVRELQNCIERAVTLTEHARLVVADLPRSVQAPHPARAGAADRVELISLEEVERRHIARVLEAVGGNKARAAAILRIGRKTLYRKLDEMKAPPAPGP